MGLEPLILGLWVVQAIVAVVLACRSALAGRWFAAIGAILGIVIGWSPFFLLRGPAVWGPAVSIAIVSTLALATIYATASRWRALVATLLLVTIPLAYRVLAYERIPPSTNAIFGTLALLGDTSFLLGPILCSLALREALGWLDHIVLTRRSL